MLTLDWTQFNIIILIIKYNWIRKTNTYPYFQMMLSTATWMESKPQTTQQQPSLHFRLLWGDEISRNVMKYVLINNAFFNNIIYKKNWRFYLIRGHILELLFTFATNWQLFDKATMKLAVYDYGSICQFTIEVFKYRYNVIDVLYRCEIPNILSFWAFERKT